MRILPDVDVAKSEKWQVPQRSLLQRKAQAFPFVRAAKEMERQTCRLLTSRWGAYCKRMIETERLILRPYALADYESYCAMRMEPEVARFLGGEAFTPEDGWNRILHYAGHWSLLGYGLFAVTERATGRYIGESGLADFRRGLGDRFDQAAEASWVFSGKVHGLGYAFEATQAAHDWFVQRVGAERSVCLIDPENERSLALATKLAYVPFGETTYRGKPAVMFERSPPGC